MTILHLPVWPHSPNAAHINAVLADAEARPEVWAVAHVAAWDAAGAAEQDAAWRAARNTSQTVAQGAAWGAVEALSAWPESAALLDLTPDALRTIISTCDGDVKHQAVLLLPAVIVRSTV